IAAGNDGADETIGSPGSADAALTVGAVDKSDQLADFSSRGPRVGDTGLKPDLTAPGVSIVAANAKDGYLGEPGEAYTSLDGTSMATPHVAGAAAILTQQHPDWSAGRLKAALMGSAAPQPDQGAFAQGAGRVDVARGVQQTAYAEPAAWSAGLAVWPHADDTPQTQTLTYHNPGTESLSFDLDLRTLGPDGAAAPTGMFTTSTSSVTVPAGGTATVDVTVDTRPEGADGYYSAWVVAAAGDTRLSTPIAVHREPESYDLTLEVKDPSGAATGAYSLEVFDLEHLRSFKPYDDDGSVTVRIPRGRYHLSSFIAGPGQREVALLAQPQLDITEDTTVALDGRETAPLSVDIDHAGVAPGLMVVGYDHSTPQILLGYGIITDTLDGVRSGHLGPRLPDDELVSEVSGLWGVPDSDGELARSKRLYHLAWFEYGRVIDGFDKQVADSQLARVDATYHSHGEAKDGVKFWIALPEHGGGSGFAQTTPLPFSRTELRNTDTPWRSELDLQDADGNLEGWLLGGVVDQIPGTTARERWNDVVVAPSFSPTSGYAIRAGNAVAIEVPLFGDASGHPGVSATTGGGTRLFRDGVLVGESRSPGAGFFDVPAEPGHYRLEVSAERDVSAFSTGLTSVWTFDSAQVDGDPAMLPLTTVSFAPEVDTRNYASARHRQRVPITLSRPTALPPKKGGKSALAAPASSVSSVSLRSLDVEVSFDDGASWQDVRVMHHPTQGWQADIPPRGRTGFVSLRATAVGTDGATARHTVIRAYGLR
ncbi:MAG: S8 family serine peptidase, partial [Propionibacteriales bacterium]|nr:S8 family serine peptidase [Propionibacteriales bacterium]